MTCDDDKKRMLDLLMKQQEGKITAEEVEELEAYVRTDNVLSILNAKARLALRTAEEGGHKLPEKHWIHALQVMRVFRGFSNPGVCPKTRGNWGRMGSLNA